MKPTIYNAKLENLKKLRGRYTLRLCLIDLDARISIDIHDSLLETLGKSEISPNKLLRIYHALPKYLKVMRKDGAWQLLNEGQILSDYLSNIYLSK